MSNYAPIGKLKKREIIGGILYWPCFVYVTALLLGLLLPVLGVDLSTPVGSLTLNITWASVNFAAVVVIFHSFLFSQIKQIGKAFWGFVQAVVLALALYYALNYLYGLLLAALKVNIHNANNETVESLFDVYRPLMLIMTLVLAPVTEECLCRGLIFGGLYKKSRVLAYALSMLAFSAIHVVGNIGQTDIVNTLLCMTQYLGAGFALAWAYKKSGTVWASIVTHMLINLLMILL